jgi:DNA-binding HxlR family transcriptional regulator
MGAFIRPYTQVKYSLTEYGSSLSTPCRQFAEWCGIQIKCTAAVEKAPQVLLKGRAKKESGVIK